MPLVVSWVSSGQFWVFLKHSTFLLVVSFSGNSSAAVPDFEMRFPLMATFVTLIISLC